MTHSPTIEIITIYSASHTSGARTRRRLLGLLSLAVAGAWVWGAHEKVDPWIEKKAMIGGIGEVASMLFTKPVKNTALTPEQRTAQKEEFLAEAADSQRRATVIGVTPYVWDGFAYVAGGWLGLAGLVGIIGLQSTRRMLRQAAFLMILSTVMSIAGIWSVIKWGGMPPSADLEFYAKVGGIQSSYAWFLLLATRTLR